MTKSVTINRIETKINTNIYDFLHLLDLTASKNIL